ncbi:gliding motility protein GldB-related protein [Microscilla marina]|uniref:Lipoprotein, putative n=1 Tax=Microscilla marina ATCC 23134 TaxID=313606 RepID=A1ZRQ9_MICM2|nr:gliding motility lipoprotein GldB [Microscilla marina]EAY26964.1 lipoprotein, putative [Microscilla marina ATCC 23134]
MYSPFYKIFAQQYFRIGWLIVCATLGMLGGCTSGKTDGCADDLDLSNIQVKIEIEDLNPQLMTLDTEAKAKEFIKKNPGFAQKFANLQRVGEQNVVKALVAFAKEPYMDSLYTQVKSVFGNYGKLKQELVAAFKHIKYYYPSFKIPQVKMAMTGIGSFFGRDIYMDDEVIFISPDYFSGLNAKFKPKEPYYIQRRYAPAYIVPVIVQAISRTYNKIDVNDHTLVADMVTRGKELQFVKTMMPCTHDSLITGFTARQLANVNDKDNRKIIWGHFVEKQVLFAKSVRKKRAYMGERPYTAEVGVGKECPGKIGWWVGWQIVQKYTRKFPKKTFQEVMAFDQNIHLFNASAYKGE